MLLRLFKYCIAMLSRDGLVDKRVEAGEVEQIKLMPEPRIQSLAEPWLLLDIVDTSAST